MKKAVINTVILITILMSCMFLVGYSEPYSEPIDDNQMITSMFDPDKKNLPSIEQFSEVKVGMTLGEVTKIVGLPQDMVTSGLRVYRYNLDDGRYVDILYASNINIESDTNDTAFLDFHESIRHNFYSCYIVSIELPE